MRRTRVLLLSPIVRHGERRADTDMSETAGELAGAIAARARFQLVHEPVETLAEIVRAVRRHQPEVVFNACETIEGRSEDEPEVARTLERLGAAFTGSSAGCLRRCLSKASASAILRAAGVPVPEVFDGAVAAHAFPVIVKPEHEDGSVGIDDSSVAYDQEGLVRAKHALEARGQEAIVEAYVGGREIAIALLGSPVPRVLSPGEIAFDAEVFAGRARILTYAAKWDASSTDYEATRSIGASLAPELFVELADAARRTAAILGIRDYGRVDFRVDARGRPFVIDVNPNCDLSSDGGFMRAARRSGLGPEDVVEAILEGALARVDETKSRRTLR